MPVDKQFLSMLGKGDIIVYKMRPEDLPVNPDKEWHGKILRIHLDEPKPLLEEKCFSTIHLFGGWNSTEEKFTKNQAYLWDIAKIAGECQCFTLMHHILTGIAGDVRHT